MLKLLGSRLFFELDVDNAYNNGVDNDNDVVDVLLEILLFGSATEDDAMVYGVDMSLACAIIFE